VLQGPNPLFSSLLSPGTSPKKFNFDSMPETYVKIKQQRTVNNKGFMNLKTLNKDSIIKLYQSVLDSNINEEGKVVA